MFWSPEKFRFCFAPKTSKSHNRDFKYNQECIENNI